MQFWVIQTLNSLALGGLLFLLASGFSLIFGLMRIANLTHGALFMLGAAFTLLKGAHVRTDMLWEKFSDRKKGIIDSVAFLLFFLPSMAILFAISIDDFFYSLSINEKSTSGIWQPVLWPLRAVIPLAAALLFLQGISEVMKSIWAARTGEMLVHHEKIEV